MTPFKNIRLAGAPWIDYSEATKSGPELLFTFKIDEYLYFILREICIYYPCDVNGRAQLPLYVAANIASSQLLFNPRPIFPDIISSPSQNYRLGVLDEDAQGMRMQSLTLNYPFDKGDNLLVSITGEGTGFLVGCMITGRKYFSGGNHATK